MGTHGTLVCLVVTALAATVSAQSLPIASPELAGMSSERLERIESAIWLEIEQDRMPGAVVAISRHGKLVYYKAFGYLDKATGTPMSKDPIFPIASMTKPIFAAVAMSLQEEGRLLMNQPVAAYLPELGGRNVATDDQGLRTEPARRQPTIEDLMRHTSGFVTRGRGDSSLHERYPGALVNGPLTEGDYLATLAELPLRYQPGTTFEYGPGFDILGLAMERITGRPISEILNQRLFAPLGMQDTAFTVTANKAGRQARPLATDPITGAAQHGRDQTKPRPIDCGGGCLASTVTDYLTFAQMLLNGGSLNGHRVLARNTVEYMTSDHAGPDIDLTRLYEMSSVLNGYGFGLGVAVRRAVGLGGRPGSPGEYTWGGSQGTYFWVDPREELVVVYMAQTPGDIRRYFRQLFPALVYQAIVD